VDEKLAAPQASSAENQPDNNRRPQSSAFLLFHSSRLQTVQRASWAAEPN